MQLIRSFKTEISAFLPLFGPILISQYAQIANGVVDTAMAARLGPVALGSVAMGVAWWMPVYMFVIGVLFGVLIVISQYHGAGDAKKMLDASWQGIWLGIALGLCAMGAVYLLTFGAAWIGTTQGLTEGSQIYARLVMLGFPFGAAAVSIRFYCEGQSVVLPVTVIALLTVGWNSLFNYVLMFGNFGFPELGIRGCGMATALSMVMFLLMMLFYTCISRRFSGMRLFASFTLPNLCMLKRIVKIGIPIGCGVTSEYLMLSVITLFIGSNGAIPVSAHQVAFSCAMLFFAIPAAMSFTASIRVGNLQGAGDSIKLRHSIDSILLLCAFIGVLITVAMYTNANALAVFLAKDPAVSALATELIKIASIFIFADAVQVCCNGILRGAGDTVVPFVITALASWLVCIPLGYVLSGMPLPFIVSLPSELFGIKGWWLALIVSLTIVSILLFYRVRNIFPKITVAASA